MNLKIISCRGEIELEKKVNAFFELITKNKRKLLSFSCSMLDYKKFSDYSFAYIVYSDPEKEDS